MTQQPQQNPHQIVHPQLTAAAFNNPNNDEGLGDDDDNELNDAPIAPTDIDLSTQTIRVTRPVPPTDFVLQRPLTTEKEMLDLAFR
jgi:tubby-related protein 1